MTSDSEQKIDAYLAHLRAQLRGLNPETVREIVEELHSHILDRAAAGGEVSVAGVDAALAALGSPEDLARDYITDAMLARADATRSPIWVIDSLFRWASLSLAGFVVLVGSVIGYFIGGVFLLLAVLKPFHPHTAGLWVWRDSTGGLVTSLRLGFASAPEGAREILGWWIVPLGLIVGCALVTLTTHFALWCARQYRRSRLLPPTSTGSS
jgi:uncharacterized membrane protein